jgi:hypothetical protein
VVRKTPLELPLRGHSLSEGARSSVPTSAHSCLSRPDQDSLIPILLRALRRFRVLLANVRVASSNLVSCSM